MKKGKRVLNEVFIKKNIRKKERSGEKKRFVIKIASKRLEIVQMQLNEKNKLNFL